MPTERIAYLHIAGHYKQAEDLLIDTHGAAINDPVWTLLQRCYALHGVKPTLLERDFNLPTTAELMVEIEQIRAYQTVALSPNAQNSRHAVKRIA